MSSSLETHRHLGVGPNAALTAWLPAWLCGEIGSDDLLHTVAGTVPESDTSILHVAAAGDHETESELQISTVPTADNMPPALAAMRDAITSETDSPRIQLVLPVPGDVTGLIAGSAMQRAALDSAAAVVITGRRPLTVVIKMTSLEVLSWFVYSLPVMPTIEHISLGDAECELKRAVREATEMLTDFGPTQPLGERDVRSEIAELTRKLTAARLPERTTVRAHRILEQAAFVDAIACTAQPTSVAPMGISSTHNETHEVALRSLNCAVRRSRTAAFNSIAREYLSR